jgi:hypothetical protein
MIGCGSGGGAVAIRINRMLGTVDGKRVQRVFRNAIGDWCAEVGHAGALGPCRRLRPSPDRPGTGILQNDGTDIAEDVIDQGAEGQDMRSHSRRADD